MDYTYINNLIDNIPYSIGITNKYGLIKSINRDMLDTFGYKKDNILNKSITKLFRGFNEIKDNIISKEKVIDRDVYVHIEDNKLRLTVSAYPVYIKNKEDFDIIFIFKDIKKERKLTSQILQNRAVYTFDKIISKNKEFLRIIDFAKSISDSKSTVLMYGETGTGKELFAQSIHNESSRRNNPFIAINTAAIPKSLIESELFGYVEGAFTGAKKGGQAGKFELAHKGTIFLDEIGEMPFELQTRLLRVVEEGIISRVGTAEPIIIDVRIIAASNQNLMKKVKEGRFRKDLFYRLNVLPLNIPPLRNRKDDLPILAEFFMDKISKRLNKNRVKLGNNLLEKMYNHNWPGNVRELENLIELIINLEYIPDDLFKESNQIEDNNKFSLENLEKNHIIEILKLHNNNISRSAKALEISRNTLYRKIEKYNINI